MNGFLNGFLSVAKKEFVHFTRDSGTFITALLIPLIQLCIYGYAIDFDIRHIKTVVVDYNKTQESWTYLDRLQATGFLDIIGKRDSPEIAIRDIQRGNAYVAVIIPSDFSRPRVNKPFPTVGVFIDGSDGQIAYRAQGAFQIPPNLATPDAIQSRQDILYNPGMRTEVFTIPGLIGVILQLVTVSLTSSSFVREREQGTLEQLMVTPINRLALMLGKLVPFALLAFFEMILVIIVGYVLFNVSVQGSFILLMVLAIPFILAALSLGLLISILAKSQPQAMQFALLITLPSVLLSGYVFPREQMPGALYMLSSLLPVTHFLRIVRGIAVRGAGLLDLIPDTLALCAITIGLLVLATSLFRKRAA